MTDRYCKNCNSLIYAGKSFCADCGAKWIDNRITMRQVALDFSDMYIGLDTKFARTFIDLFKKPEAVILGYIQGRRVNYMDAIRYLLLALFITGIYTFILKQTGVLDNIMEAQFQATVMAYQEMGMTEAEINKSAGFAKRFAIQVFEFQGFLLLLTMPILALVARITFLGRRYFNFTEQLVFYFYTYAHSIIVTTPFTIIIVFLYPDGFTYIGFISLPLMYLYNMYCYKRCFRLSNVMAIKKTILSLFVMIGMFIAIGIVIFVIGFLIALLLKSLGVF